LTVYHAIQNVNESLSFMNHVMALAAISSLENVAISGFHGDICTKFVVNCCIKAIRRWSRTSGTKVRWSRGL